MVCPQYMCVRVCVSYVLTLWRVLWVHPDDSAGATTLFISIPRVQDPPHMKWILGDWYNGAGPDLALLMWEHVEGAPNGPPLSFCCHLTGPECCHLCSQHTGCLFTVLEVLPGTQGAFLEAVLAVSSCGSLSELLSKPLWGQTIYPFYREVIIEVDYTQQQNLISQPLRNTETFGLKFSGKACSKHENEQRALHFKL